MTHRCGAIANRDAAHRLKSCRRLHLLTGRNRPGRPCFWTQRTTNASACSARAPSSIEGSGCSRCVAMVAVVYARCTKLKGRRGGRDTAVALRHQGWFNRRPRRIPSSSPPSPAPPLPLVRPPVPRPQPCSETSYDRRRRERRPARSKRSRSATAIAGVSGWTAADRRNTAAATAVTAVWCRPPAVHLPAQALRTIASRARKRSDRCEARSAAPRSRGFATAGRGRAPGICRVLLVALACRSVWRRGPPVHRPADPELSEGPTPTAPASLRASRQHRARSVPPPGADR